MDPLGFRTARGEAVTWQLITRNSWKKWAVLPVLATMLAALAVLEQEAVGGPRGEHVTRALLIRKLAVKMAR
jgi:hypothetical protein